jgi:putative acetyltransferase
MVMRIRSETSRDHAAVDVVHRLAFGDHGDAVAALLPPLRRRARTRHGVSLVAEVDGEIVGHVMVTHAWLDAPRRLVDVHVLSPLAVLPAAQGKGTGGALVHAGVARIERRGGPAVFLEGSPHYYARLGFESASAAGFRSPSLRIPDAAFQVVRLPAWESWMTGTFVYPDVFWELDAVGLRDQGA